MNTINKLIFSASTLLLASVSTSTQASLIIQFDFDFDGDFTMLNPSGGEVAPASGVSGDMSLAIDMGFWDIWNGSLLGPYDGLASMQGDKPLFFSNWSADGTMTGYQNIIGDHAPAYCGSHDMCADANLDFSWNGNIIDVATSFGMDANSSVDLPSSFSIFEMYDFRDSIVDAWDNNTLAYFDILSIDTDGDGILGSAMTSGPFTGFTPQFTGVATISAVCIGDLTNPAGCTYAPEVAVSAVPVPAAIWLFGSGLVGLIGFASRRKS